MEPCLEYARPSDGHTYKGMLLAAGLLSLGWMPAAFLALAELPVHKTMLWLWGLSCALALMALLQAFRSTRGRARQTAVLLMVSNSVSLIVLSAAIGHQWLDRPSPSIVARQRCRHNMSLIAEGIRSYRDDHGVFPTTLDDLCTPESRVPRDALSCPSQSDSAAARYIYLGPAGFFRQGDDLIVLYESGRTHGGTGIHVLYATGRIEWYGGASALRLLAEIEVAKRPSK